MRNINATVTEKINPLGGTKIKKKKREKKIDPWGRTLAAGTVGMATQFVTLAIKFMAADIILAL